MICDDADELPLTRHTETAVLRQRLAALVAEFCATDSDDDSPRMLHVRSEITRLRRLIGAERAE